MADIKYSILVPVFNQKEYLIKYFAKIVNQSFDNYEIVVVENQPCKLSFETLSMVNNQEDNASEKIISTKLFILYFLM